MFVNLRGSCVWPAIKKIEASQSFHSINRNEIKIKNNYQIQIKKELNINILIFQKYKRIKSNYKKFKRIIKIKFNKLIILTIK